MATSTQLTAEPNANTFPVNKWVFIGIAFAPAWVFNFSFLFDIIKNILRTFSADMFFKFASDLIICIAIPILCWIGTANIALYFIKKEKTFKSPKSWLIIDLAMTLLALPFSILMCLALLFLSGISGSIPSLIDSIESAFSWLFYQGMQAQIITIPWTLISVAILYALEKKRASRISTPPPLSELKFDDNGNVIANTPPSAPNSPPKPIKYNFPKDGQV